LEYCELNIEKDFINPDLPELLGHLTGNGEAIDQHTLDVCKKLISECRKVMEPKGGFVYMEAIPGQNPEEIVIPGMHFQTGKTIKTLVKGSELFVFFVATIGPGPEKMAKTMMEEAQYLEAYITDLIASSLTEKATQYMHDHIKEIWSGKGLKISNRYSPGYCGWKVDEQQKLFSLFPEGSCGITLSASSLMSPIKSVSAFVGAGPEVSFRDYTCELCSMKDCTFRKTRASHGSPA
jgi:hypothetical protein